jgi:hypothetical protein
MKRLAVIFSFICFFLPPLLAQDSTYEGISGVYATTANMNSTQQFGLDFNVDIKNASDSFYRVPQEDTGTLQKENYTVKISWQNNGTYSTINTGSFFPNAFPMSKAVSFTCATPSTWKQSVPLRIELTYAGGDNRGQIWTSMLSLPACESDVHLGQGSHGYEEIAYFTGDQSPMAADGTVAANFTVGVQINQNPTAGAYDPTAEGVRIWVDLNGGANPTTMVFEGSKLPGAWWVANGKPSIPFVMPFSGSYVFPESAAGEVLGIAALRWPPYPEAGQNSTWGDQKSFSWILPPRNLTITVPATVYEGVAYNYKAVVGLRTLQYKEFCKNFLWNWGDGTSTNGTGGVTENSQSKTYSTIGVKSGKVTVTFDPAPNIHRPIEKAFSVNVLPLPRIYPPKEIRISDVSNNTLIMPGEDVDNYYQGTGANATLVCMPNKQTDWFIYFKWSDETQSSYVADGSATTSRLAKKFSKLGDAWAQIWCRYRKAEIVAGSLQAASNHADGYFHEHIGTRYFKVESQAVLQGDVISFQVNTADLDASGFVNKTLTPVSVPSVSFSATAEIFYARREENESVTVLDQKDGVHPDSVEYRWLILTPDGENAFTKDFVMVDQPSLLNWTKISDMGVNVSGITVYFKVPYGNSTNLNRFYSVYLEARYKECTWKPVSESGKVVGWVYDSVYGNNAAMRYIAQSVSGLPVGHNCEPANDYVPRVFSSVPPTGKEGSGVGKDLLGDGSSYVRVKIADGVPAAFSAYSGPTTGTTGDPLPNPNFTFTLKDNNPDAVLSHFSLHYQRYRDTISPAPGMEDLVARPLGKVDFGTQLASPDPLPGYFDLGAKTFSDGGLYQVLANSSTNACAVKWYSNDNGSYLPHSYAQTMPVSLGNGILTWYVRAHVDDGQTYFIQSPEQSCQISDNDPPELEITLSDPSDPANVISYKIHGGQTDPANAQAAMSTVASRPSGIVDTLPVTPANTVPVSVTREFPSSTTGFPVFQSLRFMCAITVVDNVAGVASCTYSLDEDLVTHEISIPLSNHPVTGLLIGNYGLFPYYYKPTSSFELKTAFATDRAENRTEIKLPLMVKPSQDTSVRVLEESRQGQ